MRLHLLIALLILSSVASATMYGSAYQEAHNLSLAFAGSYPEEAGAKITMKDRNMILTSVKVVSGCTANRAHLFDSGKNLIETSVIQANLSAAFNTELTAYGVYYVSVNQSGSVYSEYQVNGLPVSDDRINWTSGWYAGADYALTMYNVESLLLVNVTTPTAPINFTTPTPTDGAYLNVSYLNVNASNITGMNKCNVSINGTQYVMNVSADYAYCQGNYSLGDGVYTYFIWAYNQTSGALINSTSRTVTLDTTPPSNIQITNQNNTFFYLNNTFYAIFTEPNLKYCNMTINGTMAAMVNLGNNTCAYNVTNRMGNYTINVTVTDQSNFTRTSLKYYFRGFNYSIGGMKFSAPEYDFSLENMSLNFTLQNYDQQVHGNLYYRTTNYSSTWSNLSNTMALNVTFYPEAVSVITNASFNWYIYLDSAYFTFNVSNNTSVYPTGMMLCGGVTNYSTLNLSMYDEISNLPITTTVSIYTEYSGLSKTSTFSNTSTSNWTLCIFPQTATLNITNTVTLTAAGYLSRTFYENFDISNVTKNKTYYLLNTTSGYPTTLKVLQSPNIPVAGVVISVYYYQPTTNYTLLETCTTDAGGACVVYLVPNTKQFVYNFTANSVVYTFGPEVLSCTSSSCYRTFTVGSAASIPLYFTGSLSGQCTYSNSTRTISCTGADTSLTIQSYRLLVGYIGNGSYICNSTAIGSAASLTCVLPLQNETFVFGFYGSTNTVTSDYLLSSGTINDLLSAPAHYGRDGWLVALALFGIIAMAMYQNIAAGMILGTASLLIGILLGFIPFSQVGVILLMMISAGALAYRLKV